MPFIYITKDNVNELIHNMDSNIKNLSDIIYEKTSRRFFVKKITYKVKKIFKNDTLTKYFLYEVINDFNARSIHNNLKYDYIQSSFTYDEVLSFLYGIEYIVRWNKDENNR